MLSSNMPDCIVCEPRCLVEMHCDVTYSLQKTCLHTGRDRTDEVCSKSWRIWQLISFAPIQANISGSCVSPLADVLFSTSQYRPTEPRVPIASRRAAHIPHCSSCKQDCARARLRAQRPLRLGLQTWLCASGHSKCRHCGQHAKAHLQTGAPVDCSNFRSMAHCLCHKACRSA